MSSKFVRNITGTKLRGKRNEIEPLDTNLQNDLLSDDEDVFVRNINEYHCLTDNIKEVNVSGGNITSKKTDKNTVEIKHTPTHLRVVEDGSENYLKITNHETKLMNLYELQFKPDKINKQFEKIEDKIEQIDNNLNPNDDFIKRTEMFMAFDKVRTYLTYDFADSRNRIVFKLRSVSPILKGIWNIDILYNNIPIINTTSIVIKEDTVMINFSESDVFQQIFEDFSYSPSTLPVEIELRYSDDFITENGTSKLVKKINTLLSINNYPSEV